MRFFHPFALLLPILLSLCGCSSVSDVEGLTEILSTWESSPFLPLIVIASFLLGSIVFIPLWILIGASAYLLSPAVAAGCSLVGSILGGLYGVYLGRIIGSNTLQRWLPEVYEKLRRRISDREVLSVLILRNLPIAPFTVVNIAIGASGVGALSFALGTSLGVLPFVLLVSFASYTYRFSITEASTFEIGIYLLFAITTISLALLLNRVVAPAKEESESSEG